jgi:hypothetical protein
MSAEKAKYEGVRQGGATWKLLRAFWSITTRDTTVSRDIRQRPRNEFIADLTNDTYGDEPDLETRHLAAVIPTSILALISVGAGGLGLVALLVLRIVGVNGYTAGMAGMVGLCLLGAPFITTFVWAVRGTVSEVHYRSWANRGCPEDEKPPAASQPRDSDLILGAPWAIVMIALATYFAVQFYISSS